jgi:hypothetical protein
MALVSFDFDGVLHSEVNGINPIDFKKKDLNPNLEIIKKLKDEAKNNIIIIVSSRDDEDRDIIDYFIKKHKLPVVKIITTNNYPKSPYLKHFNVARHYDDNILLKKDLEKTNVKFIFVKNGKIV